MLNVLSSVVVIGNGLFGSAAARHLAERGMDVMTIGASAVGQDVRNHPEPAWPTHRVYSSHNDAARLTRLQERDAIWAAVTRRAVEEYRDLERRSGISFFHDVGCLIVSRSGGDGTNADPRPLMDESAVAYTLYEPGDTRWRDRWPLLGFPPTHYVAFEDAPAGYIQPKRLIAAQNQLAAAAGAQLLVDTVIDVRRSPVGFEVQMANRGAVVAEKVLVAAGAFTNFNGLLDRPIDVTLKSEVIALAEVNEADAESLRRYPTVKYLNDGADLEAIYMVAPVRYENDRWYIKVGANTRLDAELGGLAEVQRWFNADTDPDYLRLYEPALRALWPTIDFVDIRTQPCVITYTPNRKPMIEQVASGLFVATAGNGGGAKGSDAWGAIAADLLAGA